VSDAAETANVAVNLNVIRRVREDELSYSALEQEVVT
jgi:hypothetical protein